MGRSKSEEAQNVDVSMTGTEMKLLKIGDVKYCVPREVANYTLALKEKCENLEEITSENLEGDILHTIGEHIDRICKNVLDYMNFVEDIEKTDEEKLHGIGCRIASVLGYADVDSFLKAVAQYQLWYHQYNPNIPV